MSDYAPFPNIEAAIAGALRQTLGCGVYSSVPNGPTFPFVKVQRIGGVPAVRQRLDRARLQLSVFGRSQTNAYDIAAAARSDLMNLEGTEVDDCFITAVDDDLGLTFTLDPDTGRDRYVFGVSVYFHATAEFDASSSS